MIVMPVITLHIVIFILALTEFSYPCLLLHL